MIAVLLLNIWSWAPLDFEKSQLASYGSSVGVWEDWVFVGEPQSFRRPGRVHVYRIMEDGTFHAEGILNGVAINDGFGISLAVADSALLVGHYGGLSSYFLVDDVWQPGAFINAMDEAEGFGKTVVMAEQYAFVGAPDKDNRRGAIYVLKREEKAWLHSQVLEGDTDGGRFGSALSVDGANGQGQAGGADVLVAVGAPGANKVALFAEDAAGMWEMHSIVDGADAGVSQSFGAAVALRCAEGTMLAVGAPADERSAGSAHIFVGQDEEAGVHACVPGKPIWLLHASVTGEVQGGQLGNSIAIDIRAQRTGFWAGSARAGLHEYLGLAGQQPMDPSSDLQLYRQGGPSERLGASLAVAGGFVFAGAPGADYGAGKLLVLNANGDGSAAATPADLQATLLSEMDTMDAVAGQRVECEDGTAGAYGCSDVDLMAFLPLSEMKVNRGVRLNDVWGWTDPENGREYAIVGHLEGTAMVDVSYPTNPRFLGELPRTEGTPGSTWRDIKVYKDHAFIVADAAGSHGVQIFDLTQLRDVGPAPVTFEESAHYDGIHSAHNIVIDEASGYAFVVGASAGGITCGGGLHMIDISNPQAPVFAGCFADESTGRNSTGYAHDAQCVVYNGPDLVYRGKQICIGANETAISVADITDKENPIAIATATYPDAAYVHQGWLSEDHRYYYQNDELDELSGRTDRTRTMVWDLTDLDDPILVNEYFGPTSATDHNLYVKGNLMYQTNNASGLRILDISDPAHPVEVGFFDTTPFGLDEAGFDGTWSSFPYFKSGIIVISSRREGLFIVRKRSIGV